MSPKSIYLKKKNIFFLQIWGLFLIGSPRHWPRPRAGHGKF